MKKFGVSLCALLMSVCLFTACGSDDDSDVVGPGGSGNSGGNDETVIIYDDGRTSNGSVYSPINKESFYLDGVIYFIEGSYLTVSGYNTEGLLRNITIPFAIKFRNVRYEVSKIADNAFENCSSLYSIIIPNSVTSIGSRAFLDCSGLTSITIGKGVTSIGYDAFFRCDALTDVHILDIEAWCNISFSYFSNPLNSAHHLFLNGEEIVNLIIPNSVTSIGDYAFDGCTGLTSITIPNSVTSIGAWAFGACSSLTSITIPNSVTSIGTGAFDSCRGLTSITIPNSVTSIEYGTFSGCSGLTSITIPNSVTSIGNGAFNGCSDLTSITIGKGVTSIGNSTFMGCHLTDMYCYAEKVPEIDGQPQWWIATLHVPANSISEYQNANNWKNFGSIVALTNNDPKP